MGVSLFVLYVRIIRVSIICRNHIIVSSTSGLRTAKRKQQPATPTNYQDRFFSPLRARTHSFAFPSSLLCFELRL